MKPAAWRIFRNNRWTYTESKNSRSEEKILWQALYTDMDLQGEFERGRQHERDLLAKKGHGVA